MRKLIVMEKEIASVQILAGESGPEQYAGAELEKYLTRMGIPMGDGMTVEIRMDPTMQRDSYRLAISADGGLVFSGGNGRGVIYGIYAFLEKYAGARFFMPDLETLGQGDIVVNEGMEYTPVFEYRQSDWPCGEDIDWSVKQGINCRPVPAEKGGGITYAPGAFVHSLGLLTGTAQEEQPCLSDPENVKKAIAGVRNLLKKYPDASIVSVSQNDNQKFCTCEKCAAVDAEEGSHAGTLLRFVNAVAEDIAEDYPNVLIDTLAYQYTRNVPAITKPLPNVCIRLCSIECCFSHPLDDKSCPENKAFYKDILDWNKICDRIYIWDYAANFTQYIPSFPNFGVLRENMRFFAEHGVKGMYPEGRYNSKGSGEFAEVRCYLLAKLMMNPYMSATEYYQHMDEFLEAYYGAGWRYIRAYIDFTCSQAKNRHMTIWSWPLDTIPKETYEAMEETVDSWWDKAEAMAGDRLEYVKLSRIQWRYIQLTLHPDAEKGRAFAEEVEAAQIRWHESVNLPENPDYAKEPSAWWHPKYGKR